MKQVLCHHRENLEKTVSSLKMKLARSAEEHDKVYVKLMKVKERSVSSAAMTDPSVFAFHFSKIMKMSVSVQENVTLITEINELRKELHSLRSTAKPPRGTIKKASKRPKSADVH